MPHVGKVSVGYFFVFAFFCFFTILCLCVRIFLCSCACVFVCLCVRVLVCLFVRVFFWLCFLKPFMRCFTEFAITRLNIILFKFCFVFLFSYRRFMYFFNEISMNSNPCSFFCIFSFCEGSLFKSKLVITLHTSRCNICLLSLRPKVAPNQSDTMRGNNQSSTMESLLKIQPKNFASISTCTACLRLPPSFDYFMVF